MMMTTTMTLTTTTANSKKNIKKLAETCINKVKYRVKKPVSWSFKNSRTKDNYEIKIQIDTKYVAECLFWNFLFYRGPVTYTTYVAEAKNDHVWINKSSKIQGPDPTPEVLKITSENVFIDFIKITNVSTTTKTPDQLLRRLLLRINLWGKTCSSMKTLRVPLQDFNSHVFDDINTKQFMFLAVDFQMWLDIFWCPSYNKKIKNYLRESI